MKETLLGISLFVSTVVLFPYVGLIFTFSCNHISLESTRLTHIQYSKEPVSELNASLIPDIVKDQQSRLQYFCSSQDTNTTVYNSKLVSDLYHHLLVDDARKLIFCYVPKVACSNWKRVFLIFAGLVDPSISLRPSIDIFRQVKSLEDYSPSEQEYRLRNYFKFMFIRSPVERLVSAYRNKIEHPVNSENNVEQNLWDKIRSGILEKYREKADSYNPPYPTFSEFIRFLGASDPADMNEHYKPMTALCQPCSVKYHYVGNFGTLRRDANKILEYLHVNSSWFWDRGKHFSNPTHHYVDEYRSHLSDRDIQIIEKEILVEDIRLFAQLFT